jgi:AraC-like DNA-binding protein
MDDSVEKAVRRSIEAMRENLGEPLTVDDLARAAMFSKFHFSRVFQRVTGLSPGRFLSALRLQRAKQLLASTTLPVADITHQVGFNSVGTFSTRFTSAVGVPPTTYRKLGGYVPQIEVDSGPDPVQASARVTGFLHSADDQLGTTSIGLFPQPIPQGRPASCTVLARPGAFTLEKVPPGSWYLMVNAVPIGFEGPVNQHFADDQPMFVLQRGPLRIESDQVLRLKDLNLRPVRALDPPVLLALLDARSVPPATGIGPGEGPERRPDKPEIDLRLVPHGPGGAGDHSSWRQPPAVRDDPGRRTCPPAA